MKKYLSLSLFVFALLLNAVNISAQEGGEKATEKKGWPSEERYAFVRECIKTASVNMSSDSARYYCYCMQFKVEVKYPTIEQASKITQADMQSPDWQKDIKACFPGGLWSAADRSDFMKECVNTAKENLSADKAKTYCECMLFKVEENFPNPEIAGKELTEELLKTPLWKKIIQQCLDF